MLRRLSLAGLPGGRGRAAAPLVWLALASYLSRRGASRDVWPSNGTLALRCGLSPRSVERALALLSRGGKISIRYGSRRGSRRGRIIKLNIGGDGPNPLVRFPSQERIAWLWAQASQARERACTLVALAVAVEVWAALECGRSTGRLSAHAPVQALRDLVGAAHGSTFTKRLAALERVGVLSRIGRRWGDGLSLLVLARAPQPAAVPELPATPMRVVRVVNLASLSAAMAAW